MEYSTPITISEMFDGNTISVPDYQRAYSWDTSENSEKIGQVNVFLDDLEKHIESGTESPYYFGHFLFEKLDKETEFAVVDGQQRMTTIVIFLYAIYYRLNKNIDELNNIEFETVKDDRNDFRKFIVENKSIKDVNSLETLSAQRFVNAYQFFKEELEKKEKKTILALLDAVNKASCSTYVVERESDAIQMFVFENNRGKSPTALEIIKAQFLFHIHLYADEKSKNKFIKIVKDNFANIYKDIARIEHKIDEDDVLRYVTRVHFNNLGENDIKSRIDKSLLPNEEGLKFIKDFSDKLAESFKYLNNFFTEDKQNSKNEKEREARYAIHSLISLSPKGIVFPFILKAYQFNLLLEDKGKLCQVLEQILLRDRIVGTRADLVTRLKDCYKNFTPKNPSIEGIIDRINELKESKDSWLGYWNTDNVKRGFEYRLDSNLAKFLLWKYENYLRNKGKNGYEFMKYTGIVDPELEHIAPQTKTSEDVASGYPDYTDEFKEQYLNCLGNLLLISKSHNSSIGNKPFKVKRESYNNSPLLQQREVFAQTEGERKWSISLIEERRDKIIAYLMTIL